MQNKKTIENWQKSLAQLITEPKQLLSELGLENYLDEAIAAQRLFPLRVTSSFLAKIKKGDINDPLLRQILPLGEELVNNANYVSDPLQESSFNPVPGLLHKYHGRVLIMLTSACGIHCRYCFRRDFPYQENNLNKTGWEAMLAYINSDPTITEVILSGGDPLVVSNSYLRAFGEELVNISHLKRLRIHSRFPVVLPERIDEELIDWLGNFPLRTSLVVHVNHPNEIDAAFANAMRPLQQNGVNLLNQSVMLRGVNNNAELLAQLSEKLFGMGILPYYLHTFDKVRGASHFDLPLDQVKKIYSQLQKMLPGYLIPKLVCEKPGETSKTLVC